MIGNKRGRRLFVDVTEPQGQQSASQSHESQQTSSNPQARKRVACSNRQPNLHTSSSQSYETHDQRSSSQSGEIPIPPILSQPPTTSQSHATRRDQTSPTLEEDPPLDSETIEAIKSAYIGVREGRKRHKYWNVKFRIIEGEQGTPEFNEKFEDGQICLSEVWNLSIGKYIVLELNNNGVPIKDAAGIFGGFLGNLARDKKITPYHYENWKNLPEEKVMELINIVKGKFWFEYEKGLKFTMHTLGEKVRHHRSDLKSKFYKSNGTFNDFMLSMPPTFPVEQWSALGRLWYSDDGKSISAKNAKNREHVIAPYTGGSKGLARWTNELETILGRKVGREEPMIVTRTRNDWTPVNENGGKLIKKLWDHHVAQCHSTSEGRQTLIGEISNKDPVALVFGEEHSGRVRGLGLGPSPSQIFGTTQRKRNGVQLNYGSSFAEQDLKDKVKEVNETLVNQQKIIASMLLLLGDNIGSLIPPEFAALVARQQRQAGNTEVPDQASPNNIGLSGEGSNAGQ